MCHPTGKRGLKTAQKFVINQRANCKYHRGGSREPILISMNLISRIEFLKSDSIQDNPGRDSWKISAVAKIFRERSPLLRPISVLLVRV